MDDLAQHLKHDGYSVVGQTLVGMPCGLNQIDEIIIGGDVAIVLGCDASVHAIRSLFPELKVIPALKTVGLGSWDEQGHVMLVRKFEN